MLRAISSKSSANQAGCLIPFFGVFAIAGLWIFISQFVVPCVQVLRARSWTPTACQIKSSAVASRGSGDDLAYYPDVWYSYSIGGQHYDSTRFSFFKLSFNNTGDPQTLLNAFPPNANATCYINPNDPGDAVLDRALPNGALRNLMALLPLAIGLGGMIWTLMSVRAARRNEALGRKSWQPKRSAFSDSPTASTSARSTPAASDAYSSDAFSTPIDLGTRESSTPAAVGEVVLKPVATPQATACGLLFFTLFWNGIVGVFLWAMIFEKGIGFMRVFLGLFLIPFVLVGVLTIFAALSAFAGMFIARPTLTASTPAVPLGGSFNLKWKTQRSLASAQKLTIKIEAREEAQYTRGTDTYTDKNAFYTREIFASTPGGELDGQSALSIPAELMHSFEAKNNKILWSLKVKGEVALWPDFEDEYRLTVTPLPVVTTTT